MDIKIEMKGDVAVIRCAGSLDAETVSVFRRRTGELFEKNMSRFVMDVSALSFIDSMGLGAMISLLRRVHEKKGDLKVCGLTNDIKQIFEITRLNKLFDVCKDVDNACRKFS